MFENAVMSIMYQQVVLLNLNFQSKQDNIYFHFFHFSSSEIPHIRLIIPTST